VATFASASLFLKRRYRMRAPGPLSSGHLPAWAAIIIIGCLFVFLAALWYAIVSGKLIVIGLGALALIVAAFCAMAYRHEIGA
jgi:hypothetical protein